LELIENSGSRNIFCNLQIHGCTHSDRYTIYPSWSVACASTSRAKNALAYCLKHKVFRNLKLPNV